jgi:uncharacterized protein
MRLNAGGLSSLLIGRDKEKKALNAYIGFSQHVAIIAPRRYGKTTLVNNVLKETTDDYLVVKVDVFSASSVREFCNLIIDAVYHSIGISGFIKDAKDNIVDMMSRFNIEAAEIKIGYNLLREQDEDELVKKTLELPELFAQKHGKKMIVFFDEFGDLKKFGDDFIKKMRSYFQTQGSVVYIFAGSQHSTMHNIFLNKENAFFNFATLMEISVLDDKSVKAFLEDLEIESMTFDENAKKAIVQTAKNHPFYLVKLIQEAYIDALISGDDTVLAENVKNATHKILSDNAAFFESEWQRINVKKHKGLIFKELCGIDVGDLESVSPSYKSQIIKEFMKESIINSDKVPTDPFFVLWVKDER